MSGWENVEVERLIAGFAVRSCLDEVHVQRLMETLDALPPILVDVNTMRVIDGDHRLEAYRRAGRQMIEVELYEYCDDVDDALELSLAINGMHGLPLTRADRRRAIARYTASHMSKSNRALADRLGVSEGLIRTIKREVGVPAADMHGPARVVGRDGKSYPARRRATTVPAAPSPASRRAWLRRLLADVGAWLARVMRTVLGRVVTARRPSDLDDDLDRLGGWECTWVDEVPVDA